MHRGKGRFFLMSTLAPLMALAAIAIATPAQAAAEKVTYGQLLVDDAIFRNEGLLAAHVYAAAPNTTAMTLIGSNTGKIGSAPDATVQSVAKTGKEILKVNGGEYQAILPMLDATDKPVGVLSLTFRRDAGARDQKYMEWAYKLRAGMQQITPAIATLFDPYTKGYDETDNLAQRINQQLLARHPDVNIIALHLTKPGDKTNKLWGINRPNFMGRDSDDIDTDTEKTGRIVMQVIPRTHRMEVHMPLFNRKGVLIGTIVTVYFWHDLRESTDLYGRSLGIMEEARLLMPDNRDDLFKP